MRNIRIGATALVGATLLALAGCSNGTTPSVTSTSGAMVGATTTAPTATTSPTATTAPTATTSPTATTTSGTEQGVTINTETANLGTYLVDGNGRVVYTYAPDAAKGTSTCTSSCAGNWPPVLAAGGTTAGTGVDAALLGTTKRSNGVVQVTYAGWPLYYFFGDTANDHAAGQGVSGKWWVLDVMGNQIHS